MIGSRFWAVTMRSVVSLARAVDGRRSVAAGRDGSAYRGLEGVRIAADERESVRAGYPR